MKNIITILLLLITSTIYAQDCSAYDNLIAEGNTAFSNGNYERAVKRYNLAMLNCPDKTAEVQEKILDVFREIEKLKKIANEQKLRAETEKKRAEIARDTTIQLLANLSIEKEKTDSILLIVEAERAKNDRIIGYFYFYKDSLALASERTSDTIIKYGFINKLGEPIIEFEYDEASSFDSEGFAEVSRDGNYYRINIAGEEFPITDEAKQLRDDILTLDDEEIKELSKLIYQKRYKKVLGMPIKYERPTGRTISGKQPRSNLSRYSPWVVFSNEADNPVYLRRRTSSPEVRKIQFMDIFYVVEEKEDWVKIATANSVKRLKSKSIQPVGWIPKDKLLLWSSALVNDGGYYPHRGDYPSYHKALRRYGEDIRSKGPCVAYQSPDKDIRSDDIETHELLYIYDRKNDMCLLGTAKQLTSFNAQTIKGWVFKREIQEWNIRHCLMPNNDKDAVAERQAKGIKLNVFSREYSVELFIAGNKVEDDRIIWNEDDYDKERLIFMPLMNKRNILGNDIYDILVYTNYNGRNKEINEWENMGKWEKYKNVPMWMEGFVPLNVEGLEHPLYKPYLFN